MTSSSSSSGNSDGGSGDKDNKGDWDSLLTKEDESTGRDEDYIQPNIEHKLSSEKRKECREIVREIKQFGVSQRQMLYLIYLLSLELEDVATMRALTKTIGENRESTPVVPALVETKGRIILD